MATVSVLLAALLASPGLPDAGAGRRLFSDASLGSSGVACADCHATVANEARDGDGLLRAGHTLAGVGRRRHWRGDARRALYPSALDAVDVCVQVFMGGAPLDAARRAALGAFLGSIDRDRGPLPPLGIEPALEADQRYDRAEYRGGDPAVGRAKFFAACHRCHPHGRAGLGPAITGLGVGKIARKVREGNGLLRGARRGKAWMPFFGRDRLSDAELADIVAFVSTLGGETR